MKVLVDTCIWSFALRRGDVSDNHYVTELMELIREVRVQLIGPVRQEILSGIRSQSKFESLRKYLSYFPDLELSTADYERAAEFFNTCRKKGVQGSNTDFLLCAISERNDMPVFTTDKDFEVFQRHIPVKIYKPRTL